MGYVPKARMSASFMPTIKMRSSTGSATRQRRKRSNVAISNVCSNPAQRASITIIIIVIPGIAPIRHRTNSARILCQILRFIEYKQIY